jgi:hypothetical protein
VCRTRAAEAAVGTTMPGPGAVVPLGSVVALLAGTVVVVAPGLGVAFPGRTTPGGGCGFAERVLAAPVDTVVVAGDGELSAPSAMAPAVPRATAAKQATTIPDRVRVITVKRGILSLTDK